MLLIMLQTSGMSNMGFRKRKKILLYVALPVKVSHKMELILRL